MVASNVCVRASYKADDKTVYLPVDVYSKVDAYSKQVKFTESQYTFFFQTSFDLQSTDLSIGDSTGKEVSKKSCKKEGTPNCVLSLGYSQQSLQIDLQPLAKGIYHVNFTGHVAGDSNTVTAFFDFYHDPEITPDPKITK